MRKLFISLLGLIIFSASYAKAVKSITGATLIVINETANQKILEKLDVADRELYQTEIAEYNTLMESTVKKFWKSVAKIEFVLKADAELMLSQKKANTVYFKYSKFSFNYADVSAFKLTNKLYANREVQPENYSKKQLPYRASKIELRWMDEDLTSAAFASVSMPSIKPAEADFIYAIKSLQLQATYKSNGTTEIQLMKMYINNAPHLKELQLQLNHLDLEQNDENFVREAYKFSYKIVDEETIHRTIISEDKTKAVEIKIPNDDGSFTFKIIDAANCEVLGSSANIAPSEYYPELFNKIKANNLTELSQYAE